MVGDVGKVGLGYKVWPGVESRLLGNMGGYYIRAWYLETMECEMFKVVTLHTHLY